MHTHTPHARAQTNKEKHTRTHTNTNTHTHVQTTNGPHFCHPNSHIIGNKVIARISPENARVSAIFNVQKWLLRKLKFRSAHDPISRAAVGGKTDEHIQHRETLDGSIPGGKTGKKKETGRDCTSMVQGVAYA